jgi:hypothetical protein
MRDFEGVTVDNDTDNDFIGIAARTDGLDVGCEVGCATGCMDGCEEGFLVG